MSEQHIQELQEKVAFLEQAINKLSDEYYTQQKELQKLHRQLTALGERVDVSQDSGAGEGEILDERPPHY